METDQMDNETYDDDEEEEDESDDDAGLLKPAFDLQPLKIQEDAMKGKSAKVVDGPPADGLEYLLQVRKEARRVPDVVVASRKIEFVTTPPEIIPSKESRVVGEIQRKQLASFASARRMVLDARSGQIESKNEEMEVEGSSKSKDLLSICEKLSIETKEPLITTMLSLNQDELSELLDEFADKVAELGEGTMQESSWPLGRWIFSTLAAVDEPASAENLAAMRNLANRCLETSRAVKAESILVDLDLFLLIVVVHFKQSDLIDIVSSE